MDTLLLLGYIALWVCVIPWLLVAIANFLYPRKKKNDDDTY